MMKSILNWKPGAWRTFSNTLGRHAGALTRRGDAPFADPHLLVTVGSDDNHVALCGADEAPIGVLADTTAAAEEIVAVRLLGASASTVQMVSAGGISAGEPVYTAAEGQVQDAPSSAGTYYQVGVALTSGSGPGAVIEVDPCPAIPFVVS